MHSEILCTDATSPVLLYSCQFLEDAFKEVTANIELQMTQFKALANASCFRVPEGLLEADNVGPADVRQCLFCQPMHAAQSLYGHI